MMFMPLELFHELLFLFQEGLDLLLQPQVFEGLSAQCLHMVILQILDLSISGLLLQIAKPDSGDPGMPRRRRD
jgi:hypothetical protein